jgi:hypothetical protein
MIRWTCITLAAVATVTMATLAQQPGAAKPAQPGQPHHAGKLTAEQEKCLKACVDCARECEACLDHCLMLTAQGKAEHVRTVKTCNDCGDICALAAQVIARNGALQAEICEGCARACDTCGKECEKFAQDPMMKKCAEECKRCAQACREMIKHAGHHDHDKK